MESDSHLHLKKKIAKKYDGKGYSTDLEYRVENGLIVDIKAENDDEKVFIEIGAVHGEDRAEKLEKYCDRFIHLPQIDKPETRDDSYTTISFRKSFIEELEDYLADSKFSSKKFFLKHLALKSMENSRNKYSEDEIREIGKKLEELGYMS